VNEHCGPATPAGGCRESAAAVAAISPVLIGVAAYGLLFGSLARQAGLAPVEIAVMSTTVFAGGSQFVAIELWSTPLPVATIVAAVLIVNLRHVLMGASIAPAIAGWPAWQSYAALFFLADESWALASRRSLERPLTLAYYLGLAIPLVLVWVAATTLGTLGGHLVADPAAYGIDFAFTAVFLTLLTGLWQGRASLAPWTASALVAFTVHLVTPGVWTIVGGALTGAAVGFVRGNLDHVG
jgi:4-azaleucine resistance transporter AzlC